MERPESNLLDTGHNRWHDSREVYIPPPALWSIPAPENVPRGSWLLDDHVLQRHPLPLHLLTHLQPFPADGWEHGVTDMMLQDQHYPDWGKAARRFWKQGNNRIVLFWTVLIALTSVVVLVISTDWISWDHLNRGFLPSDEVSRAFLASFILVFDLLIVMQDWEFPHFMGDLDVNLPGMSTAHIKVKLPVCTSIFKEEYHVHITGKWFNYGIIFLVLILDLNMWKNQIFYRPYEYGQYVGPGEKIFTVEEPETLRFFNRSTLTYEWRCDNVNPDSSLPYVERDMFLHSRYVGGRLDVKCLAFIPSLAAFLLFGFFVWLFGRFQDSETFPENPDKTYERIKRKSPSEHSKEMGVTPEEVHVAMSDGLRREGTPMLLSVDGGLRFGATPSTRSTVSTETQETRPSVAIDGAEQEEPAVSFDVRELSP
ncbi:transmembrane protein 117 isoform X2 [Pseudoliparis swirei]|uniref:transmembrane protein 117 isoform X2 n=1 Tax=Pseudoliparis swirei TaxID=2059687 RepID=UPI0024BD8239|nr:transmembrane protein 117 isoform X2 [Pseudoliparis swirei]